MKRRLSATAVAFALVATVVAVPAVSAAGRPTCLVSNERTGFGTRSLQQAVDAARAGDTLVVKGTCVGSTTIDRSLTLRGGKSNPAFGTPTLDGGGVGRVLFVDYFDPNRAAFTLTIENLTITNGFGEDGNGGGGLLIQGGTVVIEDSLITKNSSGVLAGGGIQAGGGSLELAETTISGNTAGDRGGGISAYGDLTISDSTISGNSTRLIGGGLDVGGTVSVEGTTVRDNSAQVGGGMHVYRGTVLVVDSIVRDNHASFAGGGIYTSRGAPSPTPTVTIKGSSILGNDAAQAEGGGIANRGNMTVTHSSVTDNRAVNCGGGISNYFGVLQLIESTVSANTANCGGGIANGSAEMAITGSVVSDNVATLNGGGVINSANMLDVSTTLTISDSVFEGNAATNGGGIMNFGTLTFAKEISTVGANSATTGGGVLHVASTPVNGAVTGGCPTAEGGNVIYGPANTPTDYAGFACLDQSNENATTAPALSPLSSYAAQTFTAGTTGLLDSVQIFIDLPASLYTDVATVRIESVVGGIPTGIVLATAAPVMVTASGWTQFAFSPPASVTKGSPCAIVLVAPTPAWAMSELNPYAAGQAVMNGAVYATDDFTFRTYVRPY